jgi:hypothetical protein
MLLVGHSWVELRTLYATRQFIIVLAGAATLFYKWSQAVTELKYIQSDENVLFAFVATIGVSVGITAPLTVAIIWICS